MKGKKAIKLLTAMLVAVLATFVSFACNAQKEHDHTWGSWALSQPATVNETVTATRNCTENDGGVDTKELPALSDSSFWTKNTTVAAGHASTGTDTYTNADYGTVTMVTPETGHTWDNEWTLSEPATVDEPVIATRNCTANDGGVDNKELPALSDSTFWTKTPGTPVHGVSTDTYTNAEYGEVTFTSGTIQHTWGSWTLSQPTTLDEPVIATRNCTENDGGVDTEELPALNDSDFWTKNTTVAAGHASTGTDTYTNADYGTITMVTQATGHTWGEWTVENVPTNTTDNITAKRICLDDEGNANSDGAEETKELPALNDSDFWTEGDKVATANYNTAAYTEYTNDEYDLTVRFVTASKLATVYDGQTYHSVTIESPRAGDVADAEANGKTPYNGKLEKSLFSVSTSWSAASLELDENGEGDGKAAPFTNGTHITFRMKDANADEGEMVITYLDKDGVEKRYVAYLDKASKYIVMFEDDGDIVILLPDSECATTAPLAVSSWGAADDYRLAISYTPEQGTAQTFYIVHEVISDTAYFGVTFTDLNGDAVKADEAYCAKCLYVKKGDDKLGAYGYDETEKITKELDGFEGVYTASTGSVLTDNLEIDGIGGFVAGDLSGKYTIEDAEAKELLCLVTSEGDSQNKTYSVTLSGKEYTAEEKPVILHFDVNGNTDATAPEDVEASYGFPYDELPTPEPTADKVFDRWTYDAAGEQELESPFVPTEDKTLYAQWLDRVDINVHLHVKGEEDTVKTLILALGKDDVYAALKKLEEELTLVDEEKLVYFVGWSLTENGETFPDSGEELASVDWDNQTVHAVWKDFPAYYGNYYGSNIYNAGSGNYGNRNLSIDVYGNITGDYTGKVTSYDKDLQLIVWTKGTDQNYFFFDEATGIIVVNEDGSRYNYFENDIYVYSRNLTQESNGKFTGNYGVQTTKHNAEAGSTRNYYAQFVIAPVLDQSGEGAPTLKDKLILIYCDYIFSDIKVTDGFGETELTTIDQIKNSKTVLVYDNVSETYIVAVGSTGESFTAQSNTKDLDKLQGVYTAGDKTLKLDGAGTAVYDGVNGTYTVAEDEEYTISAFIGEGDAMVYYEITITEKTANVVKPMVTITFATDHGTFDETKSYNKNIPVKIDPIEDADGNVFRGWFKSDDFTEDSALEYDEESGKYLYTPVADATLHAKWLTEYTLKLHYNDANVETQDVTLKYGAGERAEIERPAKDNKKFGGWYTTSDFRDGTEWTSGSEMNANVEVWAKWDEAPAYSGTYYGVELSGSDEKGGKSSYYRRTDKPLAIDPEGYSEGFGTWPFNGDVIVTVNDDGTLLMTRGTSEYVAYFDEASGLIVMNDSSGKTAVWDGISMFSSKATAAFPSAKDDSVKASYWNKGNNIAVQYTVNGVTYSFFVDNSAEVKVQFGVSFKTAKQGGEDVSADACYNATTLYVLSSSGEVLGSFGYDDAAEKLVTRDGFEGTYTKGASGEDLGSLEVSGVRAVTFGTAQNGYYEIMDKESGKIAVYEQKDGKVITYYEVTLSGSTYVATKPMVSVVFDSDYGFDDVGEKTKQYNKNVPITLPELTDDNYIFNGWFADKAHGTKLTLNQDGTFTPVEDTTTIYVQWLQKLTVTVEWNKDGVDLATEYYVGKGNNLTLELPGYTDGQVIEGLYTNEDLTEVWENGSAIDSSLTIYVKWMDAVAMYGSYTGKNVYNNSYSGTGSLTLTIGADGTMSGNVSASADKVVYDPETGNIVANGRNGNFDAYSHVIMFTYSGTNSLVGANDVNIFIPSTSFNVTGGHSFDSGNVNKLFSVTGADGYSTIILVWNARIYGDVTIKSANSDVTVSNFTSHDAFSVWQGDRLIYNFKKVGSDWVGTDGYEGTYDVEGGTITLDGIGGITASLNSSEKSGIYTVADDAGYTFDVYLEDGTEYYELTITEAGSGTADLNKTMVTVTFVIKGSSSGLTQEAMSYNKNVPASLPVPFTDTETITGWFTDENCLHPVELVDGKFIPTEAVTLYAKAAQKVTVTIDYGEYKEQVPDVTLIIPAGTAPDLKPYIPEAQGDNVFEGWYTDQGCTVKYNGEIISEDKTIYCKWINQPFEVELQAISGSNVYWTESEGVYTYSGGMNNSIIAIIIRFNASGTFTFDWEAEMGEESYIVMAVNPTSTSMLWSSGYNERGSYSVKKATKTVSVSAGDEVYILIYDFYGSSESATVSNLNFTVG